MTYVEKDNQKLTMAFFSIKHLGINNLLRVKKKADEGLRNMRGVHLKAVVVLNAWVVRNINAQGTLHEDSKFHWPPLSERRRKELEDKGRGSNPDMLNDTSQLRDEWQQRANEKQGVLKSAKVYSSVHENGEDGVPQRKVFPTPRQGEKILHPLYQKYVRGLLK